MAIRILPYKNGSRSARALSERLGSPVVRRNESRCPSQGQHFLINWGSAFPIYNRRGNMLRPDLNPYDAVAIASNKLDTFRAWEDQTAEGETPICPPWTDDRACAVAWTERGETVLCRTMLRASGGRGIVVAETSDQIVNAPVYTLYKKKKDEYRVHVFDGYAPQVVHIQQKRKKEGEEADFKIRNHDNGWVFTIQNVEAPQLVIDTATLAVRKLGLQFGAADVIYNRHYNEAWCLEVNTAPGLEGTTVEKYAQAILNYV